MIDGFAKSSGNWQWSWIIYIISYKNVLLEKKEKENLLKQTNKQQQKH